MFKYERGNAIGGFEISFWNNKKSNHQKSGLLKKGCTNSPHSKIKIMKKDELFVD